MATPRTAAKKAAARPVKRAAAKQSAASVDVQVVMVLSKETKGTFVYSDDTEGSAVPTLYVRKSAFPNGAADSITITISGS